MVLRPSSLRVPRVLERGWFDDKVMVRSRLDERVDLAEERIVEKDGKVSMSMQFRKMDDG